MGPGCLAEGRLVGLWACPAGHVDLGHRLCDTREKSCNAEIIYGEPLETCIYMCSPYIYIFILKNHFEVTFTSGPSAVVVSLITGSINFNSVGRDLQRPLSSSA